MPVPGVSLEQEAVIERAPDFLARAKLADRCMLTAGDFSMLVVLGGLERTVAEYRDLLEPAGVGLARVIPEALPR